MHLVQPSVIIYVYVLLQMPTLSDHYTDRSAFLLHGYLIANHHTFIFFISQELKEKQRAFESKAKLLSQLAGEKSSTSQEPNFKNNMAPLQRKQSTATKPNKQKAVVQPLQGQFEITQITFNSTNLAYRQKWVHGWNLNWHQCKNHHIKTKSSRYYSHYFTCC